MNKQELCNRLENKIDTLTQKLNTVSDLLHVLLEQNGKVADFDLHTCGECEEHFFDGINDDESWSTRYKCLKKNIFVKNDTPACRHFQPQQEEHSVL